MKQLFACHKTQSVKLLENSFYTTPATKMIVSLMWPQGENFIAFQSDSCLLSNEECQDGIQKAYITKYSAPRYWCQTRLHRKVLKKHREMKAEA